MTQVTFLGLGAMGARMSARLIEAGHDLTVWNRSIGSAERLGALGARVAESPREAAAGAEIVFSMVRDDDASAAVWLDPERGALAALPAGALAIECSTLSPGHIARLGKAFAASGCAFLEAPVAGSRPQAEAGQLVFLAGGEAAVLDRARPTLSTLGGAIHHVGPLGAGATVKLAVNAMLVAQVTALAELKGLIERAGADPAIALEALNATAVSSPALKGAAASMLAGAFTPLFPIGLAQKDCGYALALAGDLAAPTPLLAAAQSVLTRAVAAGFGEDHLSGVAKLYGGAS